MFQNKKEISKKKLNSYSLYNNLSKTNFFPIKEELESYEKPDFYGDDLGDYIDKLNLNIEKLKETFENGQENFAESHQKNIPSFTTNSEYMDIRQFEASTNFQQNNFRNMNNFAFHNRAISLDPKNIIESKLNMEFGEESPLNQRQSILVVNEKDKFEEYPTKLIELEKQNKEIRELFLCAESDKTNLQEKIDRLLMSQKNNEEMMNNILKEHQQIMKNLEENKNNIEKENKEKEEYFKAKLEEINRKADELDNHLKLKLSNTEITGKRDICPCRIF